MQILVLTPIHPMQIAEMIDFFYGKYKNSVDLYSIQSMALLAEETLQKEYIPTNYVYAAEIRKNPQLAMNTPYKKRVQIIFGNLDKNTKIKFDRIIAYTGHYGETEEKEFDSYLSKSVSTMNAVFIEKNIEPIAWYEQEDAEHTFPTLHHLEKFLDVLGVEKDELQSKSAASN
jgi:hypothetical protein